MYGPGISERRRAPGGDIIRYTDAALDSGGNGMYSGAGRRRHPDSGGQGYGEPEDSACWASIWEPWDFLAEIEKSGMPDALDSLILDNYTIEPRMLLEGSVYRETGEPVKNLALNDIVVNRAGRSAYYRL